MISTRPIRYFKIHRINVGVRNLLRVYFYSKEHDIIDNGTIRLFPDRLDFVSGLLRLVSFKWLVLPQEYFTRRVKLSCSIGVV